MTKTVYINKFDGGMTGEPHSPFSNLARVSRHVNLSDYARLLTKYPDQDINTADTAANLNTYAITEFKYSNGVFWGLGVQSGTTKPKIFTKSAIGNAWAAASNGDDAACSNLGEEATVFVLYQNYLYGIDSNTVTPNWWKYGDITGTPSFTRAVHGNINVISPMVHSKDDIMYFGYGDGTATRNKIGKLDTTTWTDSVLTFPTYAKVASLCEYGNYLAIAVNNPDGTCTVYLWNRDGSVATVTEKIDWGSGEIQFIQQVGGVLVGCSVIAPTGLSLAPKVVFKYYNGTSTVQFEQFNTSAAVINTNTQVFNNSAYFTGEMTLNSIALRGLWRINKLPDGRFQVFFERNAYIDYSPITGGIFGFLRTGDYVHIAFKNPQDSNKYCVSQTITTAQLTTASYKTTVNPGMDAEDKHRKKRLLGVGIKFDPLATNDGVNVFYRVDGGSWTSAILESTVGKHEAESPGPFTEGRDYEFDIQLLGDSKVSGFSYKFGAAPTQL